MSEQTEAKLWEILEGDDDLKMQRLYALVDYAVMLENKYGNDPIKNDLFHEYAVMLYAQDDPRDVVPIAIEQEPEPEIEVIVATNPGYVYLVGLVDNSDMFKIGITNDLDQRLKQLSTNSPYTPYLVHALYTNRPKLLEAQLHATYASQRMNGEWFRLTDLEVIDVTDALTAQEAQ